jgi:hypothetical protein
MLRRSLMTLCAAISVVGCVPTSDCDWAAPILPTANDIVVISDGLARDLLTHNETGARVCGWKP